MIRLDFHSEVPLYQQLYEQIVLHIASGQLEPGDFLPPVRALAEEIGINLHTVNKTYGLLRDDGYLGMDRRHGAYVLPKREAPTSAQTEAVQRQLELLIAKCIGVGISRRTFLLWSEHFYDQFGGGSNE
jgi:GntR family transcriptional regulator